MKVLMVFPYFATSYRSGMITILKYLPDALKKKCQVRRILYSEKRDSSKESSDDDILISRTRNVNFIHIYLRSVN